MKEKDFAGFVPLDKAALKGNHEAVRTLLRFGSDPSSGIKGTKAIHDGKTNNIMLLLRKQALLYITKNSVIVILIILSI